MTIAIAIRTASAIVFAADSKVTTKGLVGFDKKGRARLVEQTYDNATKIVTDRNQVLMGMVAGSANLGTDTITDFLSRESFPAIWQSGLLDPLDTQNQILFDIIRRMADDRRIYWTSIGVPSIRWPRSTLLLACPAPDGTKPKAWRVEFAGAGAFCTQILERPDIRLEGSYREVFALLHGFDPEAMSDLRRQLKVKQAPFMKAFQTMKVLRPVDKLNVASMPVQDAIELAVFLAEAQVEMDRFLPGTPACGGPIDVLVLRTAPVPAIISYPGKVTKHPRRSDVPFGNP